MYWTKRGNKRTGSIQCPGRDACELIDCWICLERLANPDCRPDVTFGLIGGASFFTFLFVFWILPLMCHVTMFWILQHLFALLVRLLCCFWPSQRARQSEEYSSPCLPKFVYSAQAPNESQSFSPFSETSNDAPVIVPLCLQFMCQGTSCLNHCLCRKVPKVRLRLGVPSREFYNSHSSSIGSAGTSTPSPS
ncbi:hypothetical protein niasHT_014447 [Heterodera trifolii]|uniref:Uncharacterized protein n=1 Tax=Heterodera trifolii TaxID=157864 RepID=A0ABD2KZH3_9BILA